MHAHKNWEREREKELIATKKQKQIKLSIKRWSHRKTTKFARAAHQQRNAYTHTVEEQILENAMRYDHKYDYMINDN